MIRCALSDYLGDMSQVDFARRVGLSRQTVQKLCSNQAVGVELATVEKICNALDIDIGQLLVKQKIGFERTLKYAGDATIVLGARGIIKRVPGSTYKYGIATTDIDGLSHITEAMTRLSCDQVDIKTRYFTGFPDEKGEVYKKHKERANKLLKETQGVLFALGGNLANRFADYCIRQILQVQYDSRGSSPRTPKQMKSPYEMHKFMDQPKGWRGSLCVNVGEDDPHGIWCVEDEKLLVEIPNHKQVAQYRRGDKVTNAAIVYINKPNRHHQWCTVIGIAGFGGKSTSLVSKHLFREENLDYIDSKFREVNDAMPEPLFLVAKVEYAKGDSEEDEESLGERVRFVAASKAVGS